MIALRRFLHSVFGWTPDARSKANADGRCPTTTVPDADSVSFQSGTKLPDADSISPAVAGEIRRARNLAKLEARKLEAAAKHRQLMASKPGSRK